MLRDHAADYNLISEMVSHHDIVLFPAQADQLLQIIPYSSYRLENTSNHYQLKRLPSGAPRESAIDRSSWFVNYQPMTSTQSTAMRGQRRKWNRWSCSSNWGRRNFLAEEDWRWEKPLTDQHHGYVNLLVPWSPPPPPPSLAPWLYASPPQLPPPPLHREGTGDKVIIGYVQWSM